MARADTQAHEIDELRVASTPERTIWNSSLKLQLELLTPDSTLQTTGEKNGKKNQEREKKKKHELILHLLKKKFSHNLKIFTS